MSQPYDPTLKALVEIAPADWVALLGETPTSAEVIVADIANVSSMRCRHSRLANDFATGVRRRTSEAACR